MENEPQFKWILTDRKGRCSGCRSQTEPGDRVLWSLIDKTHIWCEDCGVASGVAPLPPPVSKGIMPTTASSNDYGVTTKPSETSTTTLCSVGDARTAVLAVKGLTPTPIAPSREEAIAKAHAENMSANVALVGAVLELARQVEERSRLLKKQMEANT